MNGFKRFVFSAWESVEIIVISVATVFFIRTFLFQPFLVSGASMEPNFQNGYYLLIDEISYRFRAPARGEVIVFRYPKDPSVFFIKRVIGLPGERVTGEGGRIRIYKNAEDKQGFLLDETYLPATTRTPGSYDLSLGSDEYFVEGDNRSFSFDSRQWGSVKRNLIVGEARLTLLPFKDFALHQAPQYMQ